MLGKESPSVLRWMITNNRRVLEPEVWSVAAQIDVSIAADSENRRGREPR
jgi:hypothetical protein